MINARDVKQLNADFEVQGPKELLAWAFDRFGTERYAQITSFQAEGLVLVDMAWRINRDVRVLTIDTGRLPQATYDVINRVRERYGIGIEMLTPNGQALERMLHEHGPNPFYRSVHLRLECCRLRKVLPLQRALSDLKAWGTGLRRDQWATRGSLQKVTLDPEHGGLVKLNPLVDWTHEQVWDYIRRFDLPYHAYYDQGYPSIGCEPCTRPVQEGADPRSGRWWWESAAPKECGMHCAFKPPGVGQEAKSAVGAS